MGGLNPVSWSREFPRQTCITCCARTAGRVRLREFRVISRYTREEMGRVWSEEGKFRRWLEVGLAATKALAERGVVPAAAAATIHKNARVDAGVVRRIAALEAKVKHAMSAITRAVAEPIADPA